MATKVLHISTFDLAGGAARAAYRIHQSVRQSGVDSQMLVQVKSSDDRGVLGPRTTFEKSVYRLRSSLSDLPLWILPRSNRLLSPQWFPDDLAAKVEKIKPDVIHLHWVCNGFMQIETLARLRAPIVWTTADMWPLTGGCHYSEDCDRYQSSCGNCPQIGTHQERDLSRQVWQRKTSSWQKANITVVGPSRWSADCARKSSLFANRRIEVIPYCLDTQVYKPIDSSLARRILNITSDRQIVLFGAISATADRRKGFHLLRSALQKLQESGWQDRIELLIFGASEGPELGLAVRYLGRLADDISLAVAYAAADVMVVPSLQESFGQTASEALACGTPVVAFDATGLKDIVDHYSNGYLATPYEPEDLAAGIQWVLADPERHQKLRLQARQKAESHFALAVQGQLYKQLYEQLVQPGHSPSSP